MTDWTTEEGNVMKYLVLLIGGRGGEAVADQTEDEQAAAMAKFGAFGEACDARDGVRTSPARR